ncbi:MAG: glucuronate isomerase [Clostridia bacterium]|nr:glucuronate isomerase [Clostridia bacterium]
MKTFMDKDFLLDTKTAVELFHGTAETLPIIDYHCHIPPAEIAENRRFNNLTELWLGGDHYKWRAMRTCGVPEQLITGDSPAYEKFAAYAKCMPYLIGNPLYHWTHLELRRYFGCDLILSEKTAEKIWELTSEKLSSPNMSVKNIIKQSNVETLCTTDDPADTLEYHSLIARDASFGTRVLPAFRPDKAFNAGSKGYAVYLEKLGAVSGIKISDIDSLFCALEKRIDFFDQFGCRTSDHALDGFDCFVRPSAATLSAAFSRALASDGGISHREALEIKAAVMSFLAGEYKKRGWVMQLHIGTYRNANSEAYSMLGPDTGYDCIGVTDIAAVTGLLDHINTSTGLPRTIVYSVDPTKDAAIGTMLGVFQDSGDGYPKIMQGSAWWFNDTLDGMRRQMTSLAGLSAIGKFNGMLTDSRSFTSYPRHEYFRRIFCGMIGKWADEGLVPDDTEALSRVTADVCYYNTKNFFGF